MRTYRFKINESTAKTLNIVFTPPVGTLAARCVATNSSGNSTTLSGAVVINGSYLEVTIPSSYAVYSNFPAKFEIQLQVNGGSWYTEVEAYGGLVATTVENSETVSSLNAQIANLTTLNTAKEDKLNLGGQNIYSYGASYSTLNQTYHTAGKHWSQLLATNYNGGTVTSYGTNGRRALHMANTLLNSSGGMSGVTGMVAGGTWPGVSARPGLVIHDALGNDIMNQSAMNAASVTVVAITGTNYINYLKQHYRSALALMSSESRIENHTHTAAVGTWTHSSVGTWGQTCFTSTAADYLEYSVTPPQTGPLAGKVFVVLDGDIPTGSAFADVSITVDGTGAVVTPTYRHNYTAANGVVAKGSINAVPVTIPVDGNAHTIRITHAGTTGQFMIIDTILVPSVAPNVIACVGVEHDLLVHASGLDATDVALYKGNSLQVHTAYKAVVAEFPHAVYVPSTMTANGIWSGDGVHPNDRGMQQRCNDVAHALRTTIPRNKNRILSASADSNFPVV